MSTNNIAATFTAETATHITVTHVKTPSTMGSKKPSIRGIVRAAFENGTSRVELKAELNKWHPTTAGGSTKADKHINWYKSKMQNQWVMIGEWAPKRVQETGLAAEVTKERDHQQKLDEVAKLKAQLAALEASMKTTVQDTVPVEPEAAPSMSEAERRAAEIDARLADEDMDLDDEPMIVEAIDAEPSDEDILAAAEEFGFDD